MLNPGCHKPFDWGFFANPSHKMVSLRMAFGFTAWKYGYGSQWGPQTSDGAIIKLIWCKKMWSPCIQIYLQLRCAGWVPAPASGILLRLLFEVYAGEIKVKLKIFFSKIESQSLSFSTSNHELVPTKNPGCWMTQGTLQKWFTLSIYLIIHQRK